MIHDRITPFLLERYLAGEASPDEVGIIENWCRASDDHAALVTVLRRQAFGGEGLVDVDAEWWRIQASVTRSERKAVGNRDQLKPVGYPWALGKRSLRGNIAFIAAVFIVATVAIIVDGQGGFRLTETPSQVLRYTTAAGQYANVTLAPGLHAQLGPVTTILVTTSPKNSRIEARISGEALFTATHHPQTSFQVITKNAITRVLGTTFLVRCYDMDRVTRVVVADGRVSVSGTLDSVGGSTSALTAHTLGMIDDSGHVSVTPNVAVDDYTTWITGRLVFRNTPLRDVVAEVGRAYGVEIRIADSPRAKQHFDWTVSLAQQSLSNVLEALGSVLDAHPVRMGHIITFLPGRSAPRRFPDLTSPSSSERQYGK